MRMIDQFRGASRSPFELDSNHDSEANAECLERDPIKSRSPNRFPVDSIINLFLINSLGDLDGTLSGAFMNYDSPFCN